MVLKLKVHRYNHRATENCSLRQDRDAGEEGKQERTVTEVVVELYIHVYLHCYFTVMLA